MLHPAGLLTEWLHYGCHLGSFATELQAAMAYDDWASRHYGDFAYLNFPERKEVKHVGPLAPS